MFAVPFHRGSQLFGERAAGTEAELLLGSAGRTGPRRREGFAHLVDTERVGSPSHAGQAFIDRCSQVSQREKDRNDGRPFPVQCLGDLTATYKIRDEWRRQVSPAPGTATFPADVPVGSPLHRFVEALAATGITGGCGPNSYCPDTAVTRGQMAVFLSVALGLNWGGIP